MTNRTYDRWTDKNAHATEKHGHTKNSIQIFTSEKCARNES